MRIASLSLSAVGQTPWVNVDEAQAAFGVGFNVDLDSAASGITFKIEHTFDDIGKKQPALLSRSATTVTVACLAHSLNVGDSVVVLDGDVAARTTGLSGTFQVVSVVDVNNFTYTSTVSGTVNSTGVNVVLLRVQPHSSITASTASVDGNYAFPVEAIRLNVTAWAAGKATLTVVQGRK